MDIIILSLPLVYKYLLFSWCLFFQVQMLLKGFCMFKKLLVFEHSYKMLSLFDI